MAKWQDQSGNGNDALQPTVVNQPNLVAGSINGQPAMQFVASSSTGFSVPYVSAFDSSQVSVFAVVRKTIASANGTIVLRNNGASYPFYLDVVTNSPTIYLNTGAAYVQSPSPPPPLPTGTPGILEATYDQTNLKLYINGALSGTPTAYTTALTANGTPILVGCGLSGVSGWDGQIAEVLIFNRALNDSERQHVEAYLTQRYGLGSAPTAPAPTLSEGQGTYGGDQHLTITPNDPGQTISYTTDGSDPATSGTKTTVTSSTAIDIAVTTTLRLLTTETGFAGNAQTLLYTIDPTANFDRSALLGWYRADLGVVNGTGTAVAKWQDQSGNGNDAIQNTTANQPVAVAGTAGVLNNKPMIHFNASAGSSLSAPYVTAFNSSQITLVAVVRKSTTAPTYSTIAIRNNGSAYPYFFALGGNSTPELFLDTNPTAAVSGTLANNTFGTIETVYDQATARLFINSALQQTTPLTTALIASTTPMIIGNGYAGANPFDGDIAELMVFSQGLKDIDRKHVEAYLYQKYAILGSQPLAIAPALSESGGTYSGPQTVTLTPADSTETILYTTDGSDPASSGTATTITSTAQINVLPSPATTTTLRTVTRETGFADNAQTFTYTLDATATFNRSALAGWYRADVGIINGTGSAVAKWQDQSGGGNDAVQVTSAKQPTFVTGFLNGKPALLFNSTSATRLTIPNATALNNSQASIFAVIKKTTTSTSAYVVTKADSGTYPYALEANGTGTANFYLNSGGATLSNTSMSSPGIEEGIYDQVSARLFVNGGSVQSTPYTTQLLNTNTDPVAIGGGSTGSYFDGDIAEVLIFNQGLSDADRQHVEAYLYQRYAIGQPTLTAPTLSEGQGTYGATQIVTLTPSDVGQTLYYTTDGTDPSSSGTRVAVTSATTLTIGSTTTLRTFATETGFVNNSQTYVYTIDPIANFNRSALMAWYRADVGVVNGVGSAVAKWQDQSGNGYDASQTTSANQPTWASGVYQGQPALHFVSSSVSNLTVPYLAAMNSNQVTVFAVARKTITSTYGTIASRISGGSYSFWMMVAGGGASPPSPTLYLNSGVVSAAGSLPYGQFDVMEGDFDQTSDRLYLNGVLGGSAAYTTAMGPVTAPLQIGAEQGANGLDGDIAELIIFNQGLNDADRQKVEAYLAQRYSLPSFLVAPSNLTVGYSGTSATFNWTEQTPSILSYTLQQSTDGTTWTTAASGISGAVTTYTLTGLTSGTNYSFRLQALINGTTSSPSAVATVVEKNIATGWAHSLALKPDGTVWTWGYNADGQLGNGSTLASSIPANVQVANPTFPICTNVGSGQGHSLAVSTLGAVLSWGKNDAGQLGNNSTTSSNIPVATSITTGAKTVAGGKHHSLELTTTGAMMAWGDNTSGEVGVNSATTQYTTPQSVSNPLSYTIASIAAGSLHNLALSTTGLVEAWGDNTYGQLGDGTTTVRRQAVATTITGVPATYTIKQVSAGTAHSVALRSDGTVWTWGANYDGQIGNGTSGGAQTAPVMITGLTGVVAISAYADYTLALKSDGTIWGWGCVTAGELGSGVYWAPSPVLVSSLGNWQVLAAGGEHVVGVRNDSQFWNWGYGQATSSSTALALASNLAFGSASPIEIPTFGASTIAPIITQISAGDYTFAGRAADGTVWAWGQNGNGQAGDGTTSQHADPVQVAALANISNVQMSPDHGLALKSDGTVWGWGNNLTNSLETNASPAIGKVIPVQLAGIGNVTAIASGVQFSLYLKTDGTIWGNGDNSLDQMGTSAGGTISTPTQIPVNFVTKAISATGSHVLALDGSGNVWAWGANNHGQLGQNNTSTKNTPVKVTISNPVTAILAAGSSSYAIDSTGKLYAWGANANGNLGNNSTTDLLVPTAITVGSGASPVTKIFGNGSTTGAFTSDGSVYEWGVNSSGQYGKGTTTSVQLPTSVTFSGKVASIAYGLKNGFCLKEDNSVCGSGTEDTGQLGVNSTLTTGAPFVVSGLAVGHLAPTATSSGSSLTLSLGQSFTLTATPKVSQGYTVGKVDFYQEGEQIGEVAGSTGATEYSKTWTPTTWGTFHLYAVVTDSGGATSLTTISPVTVTVPWDSDGNSLPDWWELEHFGQLGNNASASSPSGDGYTILQDYQNGKNPVTPQPVANFRYDRGTSSNPSYQSFVVSLDQAQGIPLSPTGTDAGKFPQGLPWFEHIAETTAYGIAVNNNAVSYPTAFQNPVAAFGAGGGGTPLYTGQSYSFGVSSGGQLQNVLVGDLKISVYAKSAFSGSPSGVTPVAIYTYTLPRFGTADWTTFAQNGFVRTYNLSAYGLTTTFKYATGTTITDQFGNQVSAPFILSHNTVPQVSSNYYFRVDFAGATVVNNNAYWMASNDPNNTSTITNIANPNSTEAFSVGYTLDFSDRAPWQSSFITEPQFSGQPLPPTYAGKSIADLLKVSNPITYQFAAPTAAYSTLSASPELIDHPILDKFVTDMGSNPIALANYVLNEIKLTDGVSYNDSGDISEVSINPGGVSRSALGTFLEKEGSPAEQCALLVYLLRKCGISCGYVFPTHDSLQMLDSRMSQLLRMQLHGAIDPEGNSSGVPQLIPVNYPWVAAYVSGQWVHIFPWLKDTSITEGYDLTDYLPAGYQTGLQWVQKYLNLDPAIWSLNTTTDDPAILYPAYVSQQLGLSHPNSINGNLSISDFGVTCLDRKNNFNTWSDFPQPWQLNGTLSASNLVPSLSSITNIFDTAQFQVYSDRNGNGVVDSTETPLVDTGALRLVDLHNRRLLIHHVKTGTNTHNLIFSLDAFTTTAGAEENFPPGGTMVNRQSKTVGLTSADDKMLLRITYNRHRSLPTGFSDPQHWDSFLGISDDRQIIDTRPFRKGDMLAICLDYGRVTQDMLDAQAANFQTAQNLALTTSSAVVDPEVAVGTPLYVCGMQYYKSASDFSDTLTALNKVNVISFGAHGLAKISPQRNSDGTLPNNGDINLIHPNVDMAFQRLAWVNNGSLHADSGLPENEVVSDWLNLLTLDLSAQEHIVINNFFATTDSISTTNLLTKAEQQNRPMVLLTNSNYTQQATLPYTVQGTTLTLHDWADANGGNLWEQATQYLAGSSSNSTLVYMTPGPVLGANSTWDGMGAFVVSPSVGAALISQNLITNGGSGFLYYVQVADPNYFSKISFTSGGAGAYQDVYAGSFELPVFWSGDFILAQFSNSIGQVSGGSAVLTPKDKVDVPIQAVELHLGGTLTLVQQLTAFFSMGTPPLTLPNHAVSQNATSAVISDPVNVTNGDFYIHHDDLHINGPLPIDICRNYDSLDGANGSFGQSWKLGYLPYLIVSQDNTVIYAAEKDGSVVAYRNPTPTASGTNWVPTTADNPNLSNQWGDDAAGSVGNLYNNYISLSGTTYALNGVDGSVRTFVVASYPTSGTPVVSRQRPYLQTWRDAQGNYLTFTFGSDSSQPDYGQVKQIASSNGASVALDYDAYGHITHAIAPDGRIASYAYDQYGDLTSATMPDGSVIKYTYSHKTGSTGGVSGTYSEHLITEEDKPQGRILQNVYDSSQRVIQQNATCGTSSAPVKNVTFNYVNSTNMTDKTITGYTEVFDAFNRKTRYDYLNSQITVITDPLSHTIQQTWYQPGDNSTGAYPRSLKQMIDKRGLTTNFFYDTNGNTTGKGNLTQIDTVGDVTGSGTVTTVSRKMDYNSSNLPVKITDLDATTGNYTHFTYATVPFLPDSVERENASGIVSQTVYSYNYTATPPPAPFAYGTISQVITKNGTTEIAKVGYAYNSSGYPTAESPASETAYPAASFSLTCNSRGELIKRTNNGNSRSTGYAYDGLGNCVWQERRDGSGNLVAWHYDYYNPNSEIEWSQGSRYNPVNYTQQHYDGAGRVSEVDQWRSEASADGSSVESAPNATVHNQYDLFGDLLSTTDPLGNSVQMGTPPSGNSPPAGYDAIGRMLSRQRLNASGTQLSSESFTYENGDLVATYTNPLGLLTTNTYSQLGQISGRTVTNPASGSESWRYQTDGRLSTYTMPDGESWNLTYANDDLSITYTLKNSSGTVQETRTKTFDPRGFVTSDSIADESTFTFTTTYDGLGRVNTATGPSAVTNAAQQSLTYVYNPGGDIYSATNALGEATITDIDALGRPTLVQIETSGGGVVRSRSYAYAPDQQSVTITDGTSTGVTTAFTDFAGQTVLVKHADGTFTRSAYDADENLTSSTDELGRTTSYAYDGLNHPSQQTLPDGALTAFTFDVMGNLQTRAMPAGLTWNATYDNASRILTEYLNQSGSNTRSSSYVYNLTGTDVGRLHTFTDPRSIVSTYSYDSFGRASTIAAVDPSTAQLGVTQVLTYDKRNLLTQLVQTYQNSAVGTGTTVARSFDGYGGILTEQVTVGTTLTDTWQQAHDAAGRRTALTELNYATTPLGYTYQADGQLASTTFNGSTYSYAYGTDGLLTSRTTPWNTQSVVSRDSVGRITEQTQSVGGSTVLDEKLFWRGDSTLSGYTANRTGTGTWNEARQYVYDVRGHLLTENYAPSSTGSDVLNYHFDNDVAAGLGLRTAVALKGTDTGSNTQTTSTWARPYQQATTSTLNDPRGTPVTTGFDTVGQMSTHNPSTNNDTMTWDANGRMAKYSRRDTSNNGFNLNIVYDGFGRRLSNSNQLIMGGTNYGAPTVSYSEYDPEVEFLEAASSVGTRRRWLVHGPDVDGSYGGLNGTGGTDAVVNVGTSTTGMMSDAFGNTVASGTGTTVAWNTARSLGYGPQPGTTSQTLDNAHDVSTAMAWRGKYIDASGFYYLGARYYDPAAGSFLSADPLGHGACMDLYTYCNGDPINGFDPDGRESTKHGQQSTSADYQWHADYPNAYAAYKVGGEFMALIQAGIGAGRFADEGSGNMDRANVLMDGALGPLEMLQGIAEQEQTGQETQFARQLNNSYGFHSRESTIRTLTTGGLIMLGGRQLMAEKPVPMENIGERPIPVIPNVASGSKPVEVETTPPIPAPQFFTITEILQLHLNDAIARYNAEGFTRAQQRAIDNNLDYPSLANANRGNQIDKFFKESILLDPRLSHLEVTPRFKFGPDVYDPETLQWWDVTTPEKWNDHVQKYWLFPNGTPLLTK